MKLNCDCVRDVLLYSEKSFNEKMKPIYLDAYLKALPSYSCNDITDALTLLSGEDYLCCNILYGDGEISEICVNSITSTGYEFLELVRPKTRWEKFKAYMSNTAVPSISKLFELIKIFSK